MARIIAWRLYDIKGAAVYSEWFTRIHAWWGKFTKMYLKWKGVIASLG
jgi:hypothetical protein